MKYGLSILLNNACTKTCKYCYETNKGDQILSFENVDFIIQKFKKDQHWNQSIQFFGGEPSLSLQVIKEIYEKYPKLNYSMISNGYFLNETDYELYLQSLKSLGIAFSLEGTKKAHAEYRGAKDNYLAMRKAISDLHLKGYRVSVNTSINQILAEDIDEFINNTIEFNKKGIGIHFYNLKSDTAFDSIGKYLEFIKQLKEKNYEVYLQVISFDPLQQESDTEYLCSFDNHITISSNLKVIPCAWLNNEVLLDASEITDTLILNTYIKKVAEHHKTRFETCNNCEVPVGECQVSCVPFIEGELKKENYDLLELVCGIQKINRLLRLEERRNLNGK